MAKMTTVNWPSALVLSLTACASAPMESPSVAPAPPVIPRAQIRLDDGDANHIVVEGIRREGPIMTFAEVKIDGAGWLVLHPFKDGRPDGKVYVGATYLPGGISRQVSIELDHSPSSGQNYLVMLHRDANENQQFDFVFVDDRNVVDHAVFEGSTMIAHIIQAP